MEIKEGTFKGTRILEGYDALKKRKYIHECCTFLYKLGFSELQIPIINFKDTFASKVGDENRNMMFEFTDRGNRELVLSPEYTAIVQPLAATTYKYKNDVKLFYIGECFRNEKPQYGRWRQFTQLGVEVLNPKETTTDYLINLCRELLSLYDNLDDNYVFETSVKRGLDYYKDGKGFQVSNDKLGAQKQIVGGGIYDNGMGFAIGVDRIMLL